MILDSMHDCLPDAFELQLSTGTTVQHLRSKDAANTCNFSRQKEDLGVEWPDLRYLSPHVRATQRTYGDLMFESVEQQSVHKMQLNM